MLQLRQSRPVGFPLRQASAELFCRFFQLRGVAHRDQHLKFGDHPIEQWELTHTVKTFISCWGYCGSGSNLGTKARSHLQYLPLEMTTFWDVHNTCCVQYSVCIHIIYIYMQIDRMKIDIYEYIILIIRTWRKKNVDITCILYAYILYIHIIYIYIY